MNVELIYFAAQPSAALEERLSALGVTSTRTGQTRREFLVALSEALTQSSLVLAAGEVNALIDALSRGLGLPLTAVDWTALGVEGDADAKLPQGALPLLLDGGVKGLILESGPQAILAVDSEAAAPLFDAYLAPYLEARAAAEPAAEPEEKPAEAPVEEAEAPIAAPSAEPEADMKPAEPAYDVFAGMENADVDFLDQKAGKPEKKKHRKFWIPILCVMLVLALVCASGWYLWLRDGGHEAYYSNLMQEVYGNVGDGTLDEAFSAHYLTRFGALYQINPDVVATLSVKELHLALPVVSAAGKEDYYRFRRFDGTFALYGTPYILSAYSESDVNPNLVIRGGTLFAPLNELLEKGVGKVTLKTDSILYGEDTWEIISVMVADDETLSRYDSTFSSLSAEQRQSRAQTALLASKVDTGLTADDLTNIGLSTNFLTLLTPSTSDKDKTLIVFARRAADADIEMAWTQTENEGETESETETETISEEPGTAAQGSTDSEQE